MMHSYVSCVNFVNWKHVCLISMRICCEIDLDYPLEEYLEIYLPM